MYNFPLNNIILFVFLYKNATQKMTKIKIIHERRSIVFSKKLQELRKNKSLSQPELAKELGVSDRSISLWERGISMPNTETTIKIADYFEVTIDCLLGRNDKYKDLNIISLQRAYEKLDSGDKKKMMEINKLMFEKAFSSDLGDDDGG